MTIKKTMNSLTYNEKDKLAQLFILNGYVLNFSDSTFKEFFENTIGIDIHSEKYIANNGASKGKKLKEFLNLESDNFVGKAIKAMIEYMEEKNLIEDGKNNLIQDCKKISERLLNKVNLNKLKEHADNFDSKHLNEEISRIEHSVETDPSLAIGTAKELIETCCKTILDRKGKTISENPDIRKLTKETLKELKLIPESIPDTKKDADIIKSILQNLGAIPNGLAELRNRYGTGHGKNAGTKGLLPRHAKLAVGAAATFVTFVFDTYSEQENDRPRINP